MGGLLDNVSGPSTEVIDLTKSSLTCNSFGDVETDRLRSVGGLLQNTPIVCGGSHDSSKGQSCRIFGKSQTVTMTKSRFGAASVVLNSTTMWVMGGTSVGSNAYSPELSISSTEFITLDTAVSGPNLPFEVAYHCAVKLNESHIYVIGGYVNKQETSDVYVFNPLDNFSYKYHSAMNYQRRLHGCAVAHVGESSIIVVAGGYKNNYLDSVEIFDHSIGHWNIGKKYSDDLQLQMLISFTIFTSLRLIACYSNF